MKNVLNMLFSSFELSDALEALIKIGLFSLRSHIDSEGTTQIWFLFFKTV